MPEVVPAGLLEQAPAEPRRARLELRDRRRGGLDGAPCGIVTEAEMTVSGAGPDWSCVDFVPGATQLRAFRRPELVS